MLKRALLGWTSWPGSPRIERIGDPDWTALAFRLVEPMERQLFEQVTRGRAASLPSARTLSRRRALAAVAHEAAKALEWELTPDERHLIAEFAQDASSVPEGGDA